MFEDAGVEAGGMLPDVWEKSSDAHERRPFCFSLAHASVRYPTASGARGNIMDATTGQTGHQVLIMAAEASKDVG